MYRKPIAIHARARSFSDKWISYCELHGIPYKVVDCYQSDIVRQLEGCSGLMWHWSHSDAKAALFARQLTLSLEKAGLRVFPDSNTSWHYDDKVGQKYLLEAVGAPLVPSHVFFDRKEALLWADNTTYPKVFKLAGGAGASNVKLATSATLAKRWINRSFRRGWPMQSRLYPLREALWHLRRDRTLRAVLGIGFGLARIIVRNEDERAGRREKGYAYFQDFIPGNSFDIRAVVIGRRCYAFKRGVRKGDFRASGSGIMIHDPTQIPLSCVVAAFATADAIGSQCLAFDFVLRDEVPLIVETSYAFALKGYKNCVGYWDRSMDWHDANITPEEYMIEDFIATNSFAIRNRILSYKCE